VGKALAAVRVETGDCKMAEAAAKAGGGGKLAAENIAASADTAVHDGMAAAAAAEEAELRRKIEELQSFHQMMAKNAVRADVRLHQFRTNVEIRRGVRMGCIILLQVMSELVMIWGAVARVYPGDQVVAKGVCLELLMQCLHPRFFIVRILLYGIATAVLL